MFYEGVRFIVFVVAVQRDRIHKSAWKEKIQNYAPFEFNKRCNFDKKQLNWTLIYRNKLIQKVIVAPFELDKCEFKVKLAF